MCSREVVRYNWIFKYYLGRKSKLKKSPIQASPLPGGLAGTAWEPSKLPNYVSITPPSISVVCLSTPPPTFFFSLSLLPREQRERLIAAFCLWKMEALQSHKQKFYQLTIHFSPDWPSWGDFWLIHVWYDRRCVLSPSNYIWWITCWCLVCSETSNQAF
jgi:hypothetical protein